MDKHIQFVTFKEDNLLEIIGSNYDTLMDWIVAFYDEGHDLNYTDDFLEWVLEAPKTINFKRLSEKRTKQIVQSFFDYLEKGTKTKIKRKYAGGIYLAACHSALIRLQKEGDEKSIQLWEFLCKGRAFKNETKFHKKQIEEEVVYGYITGNEVNYLLDSLINIEYPPDAIDLFIEYFREIRNINDFVYFYIL